MASSGCSSKESIGKTRIIFVQVSQESLRLAQQSITLRKAMLPFDFVSERGCCRLCSRSSRSSSSSSRIAP